ncbi:phosphoribosyltransferase family protein [Arundinibacter roseus]|uniref:Phosphoribosyltransferase n=1 Tax=Arundinibacter roseus TaxID=2070510 RepID=A0A4R4KCJ0_9BACT|nr:phosphoribosyltransferase family protein [Arundinibacter roseus]TDB63969.1 phosphoribosyltransferase [Arundinibacter roseus]
MTEIITPTRQQILTWEQTQQKIRRIAFEIYERNFEEEEVILAGIAGQGFEFARRLSEILQSISPLHTVLAEMIFDKETPHKSQITFRDSVTLTDGKVVIVADDVLNTGRTLAFALQPFLQHRLKKLQVAVIVDRNHRLFPVSADYVGYALSTTFNEHVEVVLNQQGEEGVYLK